jgi:hypothetical protein
LPVGRYPVGRLETGSLVVVPAPESVRIVSRIAPVNPDRGYPFQDPGLGLGGR